MHGSSTVYKQKQSKTGMLEILVVRGQQRMDFFTGGNVVLVYRLVFWPEALV